MSLRKLYPLFIAAILLTGLSNSCKKVGPTGPQGPVGPTGQSAKGVIRGHVQTYDQYGNPNTDSSPAIRLSIAGGYTAVTDDRGDFQIDSVPTGAYTISLSGDGIASSQVRDVHLVKDSCYVSLAVSRMPDFTILWVRPTQYNNSIDPYMNYIVFCPADAQARSVMLFFNTQSLQENDWVNKSQMVRVVSVRGSSGYIDIYPADFYRNGIFSGDTVYVAVAPYLVNDASAYVDSKTGKTVYTGIGNILLDTVVLR